MATWYRNVSGGWNNDNLKVNDDISLAAQINDSSSLFAYYKKMIQLKQSHPALAVGNYEHVNNTNNKVFSFLRTYNQQKVLVVVNLSNEQQTTLIEKPITKTMSLYGKAILNKNTLSLNPYQVLVLELK
jgi:oligo-1,6-glucosidase